MSEPTSLSDLIKMLLERGNALQQFWGFYITVSLGLIAFFGSEKRSTTTASILSIGFIAFAFVNCSGMMEISRQREFLFSRLPAAEMIDRRASSKSAPSTNTARTAFHRLIDAGSLEGFGRVSEPPRPADVRNFHIGIDAGVLAAMWFLTLRSEQDKKT